MNTDKNKEELKKKIKKHLEDTRIEYENEIGQKFLEISKEYYDLKRKFEDLEKVNEKLSWENIKLTKYNRLLQNIVENTYKVKIELKEQDE